MRLVDLDLRRSLVRLFLDDVSTEFKCRRAFIYLSASFFFGVIINLIIESMTQAGISGLIAVKRSDCLETRFHEGLHQGIEFRRRNWHASVIARKLLIVGR